MDDFAIYEPARDVIHDLNAKHMLFTPHITNYILHFHQAIEITCVLDGEITFTVGQKTQTAKKGDIIFAPPYFPHNWNNTVNCDTAVVIIPKHYFSAFEQATNGKWYDFLYDKDKNADIIARVHELATRRKKGVLPELLCRGYAEMILGLILDRYEPVDIDSGNNDLVISIINYVDEHYTEEITLERISAHFGYSKYYFSRIFNSAFKCSLPSYVNSVRARAVEGHAGNENKTKVIIESGFNTLSTFYRTKK